MNSTSFIVSGRRFSTKGIRGVNFKPSWFYVRHPYVAYVVPRGCWWHAYWGSRKVKFRSRSDALQNFTRLAAERNVPCYWTDPPK